MFDLQCLVQQSFEQEMHYFSTAVNNERVPHAPAKARDLAFCRALGYSQISQMSKLHNNIPFPFFFKAVAVEILERCRNRVSADITVFLYCLDWTHYQELISFHHIVCTKGCIQS